MAKKKPVDQMSADELYALAEQRHQQEQDAVKEAQRAQLDAMREKRRALVAKQRKDLAAIDTRIRKLGGKTATTGRRRSGSNVSEKVLEIIAANPEGISTKGIKEQLGSQGVVANNLSQTLAYLKRQNKVSSPSRSMYAPA